MATLFCCYQSAAQTEPPAPDTVLQQPALRALDTVTVTAYGLIRDAATLPAAINTISLKELGRYSNTTLVQAINATPGVHMDERSPGSYRLSIRGSSLRSPFGVRNVKIYYNGLPITDPGGVTYLNQVGFYNINSMELIKGASGSLYGAGTGGVLLLNSLPSGGPQGAEAGFAAGSYGLINSFASLDLGNDSNRNIVRYQHQSADGYRQQSALRKDIFSWDGQLHGSKSWSVDYHLLYNNLQYQTPGALTATEYDKDPRSARPTVGAAPGSVAQQAQIFQQNLLTGFTVNYRLAKHLRNSTSLYGSITQFNNPTIRNYTRSTEPHAGGRTAFTYDVTGIAGQFTAIVGGEYQSGMILARTYTNNRGNADSLMTDDEVSNRQTFGFAQLSWQKGHWCAEGALSVNNVASGLLRLSDKVQEPQQKNYPLQYMPRLALSYLFSAHNNIYINAARGFAPPTSAELFPSGSATNTALAPERGWNYELGARGQFWRHFYYDLSLYYFSLENTIVIRRDALGGDSYVNGGATQQAGIDAALRWRLLQRSMSFIDDVTLWVSYTGSDFHYRHFVQSGADFSGNKLPGIAPHTVAAGADMQLHAGLYCNLNIYYSDRVPLNDANNTYSKTYGILDAKLGWKTTLKRYRLELYAGANNLLDERYSLGNDINAAGGRYYNAAPDVNYYAGIILGSAFK